MKRLLPLLTTCVLIVATCGCAEEGCTAKVNVGAPGSTVTVTDNDGTQYQVTADGDGNVTIPCDSTTSGRGLVT
jgi:hypothetical protein